MNLPSTSAMEFSESEDIERNAKNSNVSRNRKLLVSAIISSRT